MCDRTPALAFLLNMDAPSGSQPRPTPQTIVLLSGGIDSAACVVFYKNLGHRLSGLFIDYGQPAAKFESAAAQRLARHFRVPLRKLSLKGALKKRVGEVRARNAALVFLALLESRKGPGTVVLGIHSGTRYFDCTPAFLSQMQSVFAAHTDGVWTVAAPFIHMNKLQVMQFAEENGVPLEFTRSCQRQRRQPCGQCESCRDRKKRDALSN